MPLLRLDKVSLAYGHRVLLDHVDLEIRRGDDGCMGSEQGEGEKDERAAHLEAWRAPLISGLRRRIQPSLLFGSGSFHSLRP